MDDLIKRVCTLTEFSQNITVIASFFLFDEVFISRVIATFFNFDD